MFKFFSIFFKIFLINEPIPNFLSLSVNQTKDPHMRMPFLPMPFHPPAIRPSRARGLLLSLAAGATCLGVGTLSAQSEEAELAQLKARLAAMEAQMKSMQAQVALSASIAQSRKLTGPDGKEISLEGGPVILTGPRYIHAQLQMADLPSRRHWLYRQWSRPDVQFQYSGRQLWENISSWQRKRLLYGNRSILDTLARG